MEVERLPSMRRAPIVIAATAAGLVGVLSFHTKSREPDSRRPAGRFECGLVLHVRGHGTAAGRGIDRLRCAPDFGVVCHVHRVLPPRAHRRRALPTVRSVNYNYGILSVSVTVSGKKITKVGIASLDDGGNFRSQSIDQQSIPILEQQALQAQSANIQGVSGASYTSAGFEQSLQSALSKLGLA